MAFVLQSRKSASASPRIAPPRVRRCRGALPPARLAGILLLLVWAGPVTFVQTDGPRWVHWLGAPEGASAYPRTIPAGQALRLEQGTPLELRLRDGSAAYGRFLGRGLIEDSLYATRFEAASRATSFTPIALGETLRVSLREGREWTLPFAGYGERALLLRAPDRDEPLRVPFESATRILRTNGTRVERHSLARAFRDGQLPSAEALLLEPLVVAGSEAERRASARRVPVEDIVTVLAEVGSKGIGIPGTVVLGVLGLVVLLVVMANSSSSGGCSDPVVITRTAALPLTTRPFDLERGCYEGDVLVADAWPVNAKEGPAMAVGDPAPLGAPVR